MSDMSNLSFLAAAHLSADATVSPTATHAARPPRWSEPVYCIWSKRTTRRLADSAGNLLLSSIKLCLMEEFRLMQAAITGVCRTHALQPKSFQICTCIGAAHPEKGDPEIAPLGIAVLLDTEAADYEKVKRLFDSIFGGQWKRIIQNASHISIAPLQGELDFADESPINPSPAPIPDAVCEQATLEEPLATETVEAARQITAREIATFLGGKEINATIRTDCSGDESFHARIPVPQYQPGKPIDKVIYGYINQMSKTPPTVEIMGIIESRTRKPQKFEAVYNFSAHALAALAKMVLQSGDFEIAVKETRVQSGVGEYMRYELVIPGQGEI